MNSNELISVIIPVFNAKKYIEKCVDSILNQTYKNFEILLIDDGSTDDTGKLCKGFDDIRVKYIYKENSGVSSTRNVGIRNSKGKYILFIDADDFLDSNCLISLIEEKKEGVLPCMPLRTITSKNSKVNFEESKIFSTSEYINRIINGLSGGFCWGYLLDSVFVKKIEFESNIRYMEDTLFLFKYLKMSNIEKISIPVRNNYYNYLINPTSATNKRKNVLQKLTDMFFVLDEINKITQNNYINDIEYKKIRLLETEMRFLSQSNDFRNIMNNIKIKNIDSMKFRFKVFAYLFKTKKIRLLKIYYYIRKIVKGGI